MPKQETFMSEISNGRRVEVIKIYDRQFAREVFEQMDDDAKTVLRDVFVSNGTFDSSELSGLNDDELWEGIEEGAREDWQSFSYFVVSEADHQPMFVCSDWPTAKTFAEKQLSAVVE